MMFIQIETDAVIYAILNFGSLAGLIGLLYQIHNNKKLKPKFKFIFQGSSHTLYEKDGIFFGECTFEGIFGNASLSPNTLTSLQLVVWDTKKRFITSKFGPSTKKIINMNTEEEVVLPLRFESKQAFRLRVVFDFPADTNVDKKIFSQKLIPPFDKKILQYQFVLVDINGNHFDYNSSIISRDLIDLWWTLPNYARNPIHYLGHLSKILFTFIKLQLRKIKEFFGFYY